MDATKVLEVLLGQNATRSSRLEDISKRSGGSAPGSGSSGGGGGGGLGDILGSILGGGSGSGAGGASSGGGGLGDILGSILGGGRAAPPQAAPQAPAPTPAPSSRDVQEQAEILIRAMCNAAKVDGSIDQAEQEAILGRLGNEVSQDEIAFVRKELSEPLNVDAFCRSVPSQVAPQVYGFSVMTIKLDTLPEAAYLGRLAQGLGLDNDTCNRIHQQVGASPLYK